MKSVAKAILFTGFVAATGAAVGDKLSSAMGEADNPPAATDVQADPQAGDSAMRAESAPPEGAADLAATGAPQPGDFVTVTPSPSTDIVAATPPPAESVTPAPRPAETVARRAPARPAYQMTVAWAFPGSADDAGYRLAPKMTYADLHANDRVMTASSALPTSSDDAGRYLVAARTHADIFLERTVRVAQQEQRGTDTNGN